jgi:ribonuclease HI
LAKRAKPHQKSFQSTYNQIIGDHPTHVKIFTDGSKEDEKVAAAAVSDGRVSLCRLPDNASIFTAELRAILMATKIIETSHRKNFLILVDSISCIQAIENRNWSNPNVLEILIKLHHLVSSGISITFMWIPSHIGIRGNTAADTAAKLALSSTITDCKVPYSDFKPLINSPGWNSVSTGWTSGWLPVG